MTPTDTTLYLLSVLTTLAWVREAWKNRQLRQVRDELNARYMLMLDRNFELQRQVELVLTQVKR